jgi:hypothetical protein
MLHVWTRKNAYRVSVRKPEGKRAFGISGCMLEDNTKMYLSGTGLEGVNCIRLSRGRAVVNVVMNNKFL